MSAPAATSAVTPASAPAWRSMLFVPAHLDAFLARAHERGADAVVLDLEDSVPADRKAAARAALRGHAEALAARGVDVLVRINALASGETARLDLAAAASPAVRAVVVPKVADGDAVRAVARALGTGDAEGPGIVAQIEDVHALGALDAIATASPRLLGMTLGPEDFALSAGCEPTVRALVLPSQMVVFACRRAGIAPYGFPGSIGEFRDLAALAEQVALARELGFVGALCIHPAQVPVLNAGFSPTERELERARALIAAADSGEADGRGAVAHGGAMVDAPVVARARALLARAARHLPTKPTTP